jgi:hypothetical protein
MARSCAGSCTENHLVPGEIGNDLVEQRINRLSTPVDQALPADFHHISPGKNWIIDRVGSCSQHRSIAERSLQQLLHQRKRDWIGR